MKNCWGKEEHHSLQGTNNQNPAFGSKRPAAKFASDAKGELRDGTANRATIK
jgi:hypothetical protein